MPAKEFLEEVWAEAKKQLPGWAYASLLQMARARSGGRSSHRVDEPTLFEKLALPEIKPSTLKAVDDTELRAIWLRLHQWYANAKRRKAAVENIVNAALWVSEEMKRRGNDPGESELTEAISEIVKARKERSDSVMGIAGLVPKFLEERLKHAPEEILLVRDWVSVAGSAAVTEKPGDIDVVIRSDYNAQSGKYELDGAALWVALRRFLAPDKRGPQMQLLSAPAGSFTDYVPAFDLVVRKRAPHVVKIEPCPPEYEGQERVVKQARAATSEIRAQADKAKREDKLTLGEFFYQPKPARPVYPEQPQTVDNLVKLFGDHSSEWLPTWVQRKYDGANHQIHKDNSEVRIFSEDGEDNTERLPGLVEAVKALPVHKAVFPAELEWWEGEQHFPRERVAGYLSEKSEPDDSKIRANIYDVVHWKGEDIHNRPLRLRLEYLRQLEGQKSKQILIAPGQLVETQEKLREVVEGLRKEPGSEGTVAKQIDSIYPLDAVSHDRWVKYHNATTIKAVVIKGYRTKGGVWTYDYGVLPGKDSPAVSVNGVVPVGESFATTRKFEPGDHVLIEAESVNKLLGPDGVRLTAWVPRVLGEGYDGDPDTVDDVAKRAAENLVLQTKRIDSKGNAEEYYSPNVIKVLRPEVPTFGQKNAPLAFVGASLGRTEAARREPFVGPVGETFNDVYLQPLGVKRSEVMLTNSVPLSLEDEQGRTREPTVEEIKEWHGWLVEQLGEYKPRVVVALGRTAESALGDRCDFVLPHPSAVRRQGDSGEVGRKLKQIKERIAVSKQLPKPLLKPRAEGGTRSVAAYDNWDREWQEMLPTSGKGRFVYQHHWRGLEEDETKKSDAELMSEPGRSVHGDIRLEGNDTLWGWAVFLGRTEDNKGSGENNDKLLDWKVGDKIELAPKLAQPKAWLEVGADKPTITGPGEAGATSEKYSKFFGIESGTYQLGVARKHMVEIFLDSPKLKGRYLFEYAPVAGRRRWLIDKPEDQTPYAERRDLADTIGELRQKGQRWLIWAKPGERPQKIDVRTGKVVKNARVSISKADPIKRIVYGVVLNPYGNHGTPEFDAHKDWTSPREVEKTAHAFLKSSRVVGLQHKGKAKAEVVESWIEQYPTRTEYLKAMQDRDHRIYERKFGSDVLHSGAWVLGVQLGTDEWRAYEEGKINAFSPGGFGSRRPIARADMPKVQIIELVEKPA
jgi:uracil-DNA glycosylase family 4